MNTIYPLYGLGEEAAQTSGEPGQPGMLANIMSKLKSTLGSGVASTLLPMATAKLTEALSGKKKAAAGKPGAAAPAPKLMLPTAEVKKGLPSWVLPVAIGGGVLLLGGAFLAFRKNPARRRRARR